MATKKQIDNTLLLKMIKDEVKQSEIMEKFGFNTSTQLKLAYANALMESGNAPKIKGAGKRKQKSVDMIAKINDRGSLIIPKKVIENMKDVKIGDSFEVKKTASGIQLKAIKVEETDKPKTKSTTK